VNDLVTLVEKGIIVNRSDGSQTTCVNVIFTKFVMHIAYRCGSVLLWRGEEIPWGRGNFGVFFPFNSSLYSIEFGTHTKMAELIEMPFWMVIWVGPGNHALDGVHIPQEKGQFLRVVQTIQKH